MDSFPAFIPLKGARVVVAGEGDPAENKARLFAGSPAELVRLTPEEALRAGALDGARVVFVGMWGNEDVARRIAEAARAAGALVNVVDQPALSDFITPAVVDRGPVVAAVGTSGAAPVLATLLRGEIEARWPEGLGSLGEMSRRIQPEVRRAFPDMAARRQFWRRLIAGPPGQAALAGDVDGAEMLARVALSDDEALEGRVWFLAAPARPEHLTLAALRALGAADQIVAGADVAPALMAYARRDAGRAESADAAELAAWARSGWSVLRVAPYIDAVEVAAVEAAGVEVERLPEVA